MNSKSELAQRRFLANLNRVTRLMSLATSGEGQFKPAAFWTYDGIAADIFRAVVVFLHSAVEDLVRSYLPHRSKFTFSGINDISKALQKAGYDPSPLGEIERPLHELAIRRHRIVHYGDLKLDAQDVEKWTIADIWLLIQWHITVIMFLYILAPIVGLTDQSFARKKELARDLLDRNVDFGKAIVAFPAELKVALDQQDHKRAQEVLEAVSAKLTAISDALQKLQAGSSSP